jgi:hypothetical protein
MSKAAAAKVEPIADPVAVEPLDSRIATVLGSSDQFSSEYLAELIAETDEQINHADQAGRQARARSIDPTIVTGIAERAKAEDSEFIAHRLRNGLERLKELHTAAQDRERVAQWHSEADAMEQLVLKLHDELVPMVRRAEAAELEFDSACGAIDDISIKFCAYMERCTKIEARAPPGETRHLPRPIDGLDVGKFMARKVVPKVEAEPVVDYSIASRMWRPAVVLNHEERIIADAERRANEELQMTQIYADRAAAQSRIEQESQRRALASAQRQRDHENGL